MEIRYTAGECLALYSQLMKNPWELSQDQLFSYEIMLSEIRKSLQEVENIESIVRKKLEFWLRLNMPHQYRDRVLDLVYRRPLIEVPKHLADPMLQPFALWRLSIQK